MKKLEYEKELICLINTLDKYVNQIDMFETHFKQQQDGKKTSFLMRSVIKIFNYQVYNNNEKFYLF